MPCRLPTGNRFYTPYPGRTAKHLQLLDILDRMGLCACMSTDEKLLPQGTPLSLMGPLLDELPLGIALLDPKGRIRMVNSRFEALTGADRHQLPGLLCLHALRSGFCMQNCPVLEGRTSFSPLQCDTDILTRDHRKISIQLTLSPLWDENGRHQGYVETIQELSQPLNAVGHPHLHYGLDDLVGTSSQFRRILNMIPSIAQTDSSVLITGETGTGKDLLAEAIHKASDRARGPFVKVNCGALPDTLLESELFGHTKGAFTGADKNKPGRFRLADKGTIFLTEIGDLPLGLQVKLLSVLDDKMIYPLGGSKPFHADVRIIAATHRRLEDMVADQKFRQDLLFRLNVVRLHIPPLREREGDIPLLLDHFDKLFQRRFKRRIQGFAQDTMRILKTYSFPGNVRELRNIVEYAVNFCTGERIGPKDLPAYILASPSPECEVQSSVREQLAPTPNFQAKDSRTWAQVERKMILDALVQAGGRRTEAARILGWGRSTLWRKMKTHQITADNYGS